jgi:hypothetical protein
MADNIGVLGSATGLTIGTHTVYTCPANKAAKFRLFAKWRTGPATTLTITMNNTIIVVLAAVPDLSFVFTNGGGGLIRTPALTQPTGGTPAETCMPAAPIYYLSSGQSVVYTIATAECTIANCSAVGVEIDLTP